MAARYAELLAGAGVEHGLIGPREPGRLWARHLISSAVLGELLAPGLNVVDLGSGAGLPGIPLAIARPDLTVGLIEPMHRRCRFLRETITALQLEAVRVIPARAEELHGRLHADAVLARAVAPLHRLLPVGWPLVRRGGELLAVKGASAARELAQAGPLLPTDIDEGFPLVARCGAEFGAAATTVIRLRRRRRRPP